MRKIVIASSNGELIVNLDTGQVMECTIYEDGDESLWDITGVNLQEWCEHYGREPHDGEVIDILDMGLWYIHDGEPGYDPPEESWREEIRKQKEQDHE